MSQTTKFILNDGEVETACPPGLLVLDFLRQWEGKTGTKEGCKEGDCGACAILVGELDGDRVRYQPVTSCLVPMGEMQGRHVVTVEGFNMEELNPVQRAIVDRGGTQCGFCTPGIVVSLQGLLLDGSKGLSLEDVKYALSGHLCRCTGYRSLKDCAQILDRKLGGRFESGGGRVENLVAAGAIPAYFAEIPERLRTLAEAAPAVGVGRNGHAAADFLIAGGTDLYVQVGEEIPDSRVGVLNRHPEMKGIRRDNGQFRIGGLTTFEEFGEDPEVVAAIPRIQAFNYLIASWQIRNRATLSGNIVNASPIGDFTALLLALDAEVVLKGRTSERRLRLRDFYKGYKQFDKRREEILTEVVFADPSDSKINFEKVSKRTCLDIASVNSGCKLRCVGDLIAEAHFSLGGVAPIPLYLKETSRSLLGRMLDMETAWKAVEISQEEISPISDVRGSADYKRLLARQLMIAHFTRLFPDRFTVEGFYETP